MAKKKKADEIAGIELRPGSKVWQFRFKYMGVTVRKSTGTTDFKHALMLMEKEKQEIFQRIMNPPAPPKASIKLSQAIETTYTDKWSVEGTKDWARSAYRMAYAIWDFTGDIDLSELNAEKIRLIRRHLRGLDYRGKQLTETTVNRYITCLRCVYNHSAEEYNLPKLKFNIPKKGVEKNRVKVYSKEESQAIRQWFLDNNLSDMADLCVILEHTGFRLSEAIGIGKYNEKGKLISEYHVDRDKLSSWENKGDLPRTIPLLPEALTVLKRRGNVPFPLLRKDSASHYWQRMARRMQLPPDCVMHVFRHTCASNLINTGASLKEVQQWLGHANFKTTEIYAHLAPDALDRVAQRVAATEKTATLTATPEVADRAEGATLTVSHSLAEGKAVTKSVQKELQIGFEMPHLVSQSEYGTFVSS